MTLQATLDAFRADFKAGKPPYNAPAHIHPIMERATAELGFPILSDAHNDVAAAFGLRFELPNYLIERYKALGNNLPLINDDPAWTLPMPARYVIGQGSVIRYAEVNPDYTQRPDPSALLDALTR